MVKKISVLALTGLLALPAMASAGAGGAAATADVQAQVDALTKQLNALKAQMADIKTAQDAKFEDFDAKSEKWDLASRFQWSGDIRSRADYMTADTPAYYKATEVGKGVEWFTNPASISRATWANEHNAPNSGGTSAEMLMGFGMTQAQTEGFLGNMLYGDPTAVALTIGGGGAVTNATIAPGATLRPQVDSMHTLADFMRTFTPAQRAMLFHNMGFDPTPEATWKNDTLYTTRMRLNMRVKATEDIEVKARIVGYKAWGMQDSATPEHDQQTGLSDTNSPFFLNSRSFDGTTGRQPIDNKLVLDRAFMNWNNIGGSPVWFSVGRRPTTDGPPNHLRMNSDERMATPVAYMDYAFDGASLGYAYNNLGGLTDAPGRIRLCYGRGFEAGPNPKNTGMNDVDFAGFDWDVYSKGSRFLNIQSFGAFNLFNVPGDTDFPNPLELAINNQTGLTNLSRGGENGVLDRQNLGNVYQTAAVFMDKYRDFNYFVTAGWSHTHPTGTDEMGTSLLGDFWNAPEAKDGYNLFVGTRYDIPNTSLKLGAEYNHGTKNWLAFAPGHDDMYSGKLWTRGNVYEVYGIYDIPAGEAVSKYGKAFIRLGYQHYDYNYTYSGMWLGTPTKIDDIKNDPLTGQFYAPIKSMDQVYLTFEANF